jgi:DNA-binding NtrC family response regulator
LVNKFTLQFGKQLDGVSRTTVQRLQEYSWPGNIRELENVLERAVILASGSTLEIAPDLLPAPPAAPSGAASSEGNGHLKAENAQGNSPRLPAWQLAGKPPASLEAVERDYILSVLQQTNWLITGPRGAAKILHINPSTLRNRIKKLGITRPLD